MRVLGLNYYDHDSSAQDAVVTFFSSGLDMLCIGPFLLSK